MCGKCDYREIIEKAGLEATANRVVVLEVIGENNCPLTAGEIYQIVVRNKKINRATVYRILDLFVEHQLIERLSTGGRAVHFGIAPNKHHRAHPHFYCTSCGQMDCLAPGSIEIDARNLIKTFSGTVQRIEIRVDGICRKCLK